MELYAKHPYVCFYFQGKGRSEGLKTEEEPIFQKSLPLFFFPTSFESQTKNKIFLLIDNAIQRSGCQSCIQNFRLGLWRSNEKNGKAVASRNIPSLYPWCMYVCVPLWVHYWQRQNMCVCVCVVWCGVYDVCVCGV